MNYSFQVDSGIAIKAYTELDNYSIQESEVDSNICAVYFSSNEIYYPNTESVFERDIFKKNRFEWFGCRIKDAEKHIFSRDVRNQWYLTGISASYPRIDSLMFRRISKVSRAKFIKFLKSK